MNRELNNVADNEFDNGLANPDNFLKKVSVLVQWS